MTHRLSHLLSATSNQLSKSPNSCFEMLWICAAKRFVSHTRPYMSMKPNRERWYTLARISHGVYPESVRRARDDKIILACHLEGRARNLCSELGRLGQSETLPNRFETNCFETKLDTHR